MVRTKISKPRTDAEKERDKDKRLQCKFGITLADRNAWIRQQDNKCKICKGPLDAYGPPNIDHFHFYISVVRVLDEKLIATGCKWLGQSYDEHGAIVFSRYARTQIAAKASVKIATMPWSIRGLLCFKCNRGLGAIEKFFNAARRPENLLPVIEYFQVRLDKSLDSSLIL